MGKDKFEFARIASSDEVAEYLTSLAAGLKRGEVTLEPGKRTLHLTPSADLKLELRVRERDGKGKLVVELVWKRRLSTKAVDLRVEAGPRPGAA